uniref:DEAD-box ATP-dependent RNA helicase 38-like isoform X1 n=1 Tax=Erigeron canadensis TaxID=72917 RepID=UPI001CB8E42B|nr:DEAD-box ATP-dependent RNA helicase 38-like isoform X1 [Erigeron canadensis]
MDHISTDCVKQYKVNVPDECSKFEVTADKLIRFELNKMQAIIYVGSRKTADMLYESLDKYFEPFSYDVSIVHADLAHKDRDTIVKDFNERFTQILITTDSLAEGFDHSLVNLVVNYDLPVTRASEEPDIDVYLQRLCFYNGAVFNLLCGNRDNMIMERIEKNLNQDVIQVPSWTSIEKFILASNRAGLN